MTLLDIDPTPIDFNLKKQKKNKNSFLQKKRINCLFFRFSHKDVHLEFGSLFLGGTQIFQQRKWLEAIAPWTCVGQYPWPITWLHLHPKAPCHKPPERLTREDQCQVFHKGTSWKKQGKGWEYVLVGGEICVFWWWKRYESVDFSSKILWNHRDPVDECLISWWFISTPSRMIISAWPSDWKMACIQPDTCVKIVFWTPSLNVQNLEFKTKKNSVENPPLKSITTRLRFLLSHWCIRSVRGFPALITSYFSFQEDPSPVALTPTKSHIHIFIHIFHKKHHGLNMTKISCCADKRRKKSLKKNKTKQNKTGGVFPGEENSCFMEIKNEKKHHDWIQ